MEKILIIYHRVDFDGVFSGKIVEKFIQDCGFDAELFGWNYGDELPNFNEIENNYSKIIMVDISFSPEIMIYLRTQCKIEVIWIDHHKTAIEFSYQNQYSDLPGIRRNGTAACELCWEYCYPNLPVPKVIEFVGCYDVWDKIRYSWDNIILPFQYGLKTRYNMKTFMLSSIFNDLIYENIDLDEIIHEGEIILKYLERTWSSACKVYSFEVRVAGKYRGICLLTTEFTSNVFNSVMKDYDVVICCNRKGPDTFNLSMYKEQDKCPEFSCGQYLSNYNGGGHNSAAGCTIGFEDFRKLIVDCEI